MIAVSPDITIDRPPQAVFDFVSDPANLPRWNPVFRSRNGRPTVRHVHRHDLTATVSATGVTWHL